MHISVWVGLFLIAFFGAGHAAERMPLGASALTHGQAAQIQGCGVRVTAGRAAQKSKSLWMDLSFNVYASGVALVQAIAYEMPPSTYEGEAKPRRLSVQRAWVKPRDESGTTRLGENTEARDTLIYALTLEDAIRLFGAVAAAEPLAIGMRPWGEPREWLFEGIAELPDGARAEIATCLAALVN